MTSRRSSFFCRKLDSVIDSTCSSNESSTSEEDQIILKHVEAVERTISDWKAEYWRTKAQYKELEKYKDNVNVIQYNQCKDILLPEDIKFLNERFDYPTLMRGLETLITKVEIAKSKMCQVNTKMNGQVIALQQAIVEVKRRICKFLLELDESEDLFIL